MEHQIGKRGGRAPQPQSEFTVAGDDRIIGSTVWRDRDGTQIARYQVLTIRDDKIVDLQGCETRQQAERFARRRVV